MVGFSRAHLFDGVLLHSDTADFQLCDIHDEQIRKYIDDPSNLTEVCDVSVPLTRSPDTRLMLDVTVAPGRVV
jgi:hypothetical protein